MFHELEKKVVDMPVVFNDRCRVSECRNCEGPAVASDKVVFAGAIHRRFGRPCDHAETIATVKMPQTQFIAGVSGPSCCATETVYAQRKLCCWLRGGCIWRWGRR